MAPRSTANATAPSRPRCIAWCRGMRPVPSPTPRPASGPSCPGSSKMSSTPSSNAASWPRLPEAALRRVRPRQTAGLQLQAARASPRLTCRTSSTACTKAAATWPRPAAKKARAWGWHRQAHCRIARRHGGRGQCGRQRHDGDAGTARLTGPVRLHRSAPRIRGGRCQGGDHSGRRGRYYGASTVAFTAVV